MIKTSDRARLRAIATLVRTRVIALAHAFGIRHEPNLRGLCGIATDGVTRALLDAGFSATSVYGCFSVGGGWSPHCWTEVAIEDHPILIVDVTATQFQNAVLREGRRLKIPPVTIRSGPGLTRNRQTRSWFGWEAVDRGAVAFDRTLRSWERPLRAATYRRFRWWELQVAPRVHLAGE
jgi:hypothetical protein